MKHRTRTYYTDGQKALMWERWREGWTLHEIAHLFNRAHTSVRGVLAQTGGIRPPQRSRSAIALTLPEREEISRSLAEGHSIRSIGAQLGRAPSTVSREIGRNGGQADYRATEADNAAWDRALRPQRCKLAEDRALARIVADKLRLLWCHRNKSPGGSSILTRATRAIACHTRPFTAASSSRRVAR